VERLKTTLVRHVSVKDMSTRSPSLSWRENYLRSVEFRGPEYIPCRITVMWPLWNTYRERLEEVALKHPLVFPGFKPGSVKYGGKPGILRANRTLVDPFGCVWSFNIEGFQGQVVHHPLKSWEDFKKYEMPDPEDGVPVEGAEKPVPWNAVFSSLDKARSEGNLVIAGMPHGFFFQRLYYLRGFTNLMRDFIQKPPQIYELIERLTEFNLKLVDKFLSSGRIDVFYFGDDLGTQTRMPISPRTFREFIFPSYAKIFQKIRSLGIHVYLHTDGHVVEVLDQLIEAGADVLNIQDRVNGLDNIASMCKGRVCIDLDIDRQYLVPFGRADDIRGYIKRVVELLAMKKGGLMLEAEIHPPTPLENIEAVAKAMEEFMWL
jgi:hypothetical protein